MIRVRHVASPTAGRASADRVLLHHQNHVRVYTGDVASSARPVVLEALLGSCVAVCLHDPVLGAGGMNHILLPGTRAGAPGTRFGAYAMEMLIDELMKQGGDRRRFVAKAFGGARVLSALTTATIGEDNAEFVRKFLARERIPLIAQHLGGTRPVHVDFKTDTGKARVHLLGGAEVGKITRAESAYWRSHLGDGYISGEISLF